LTQIANHKKRGGGRNSAYSRKHREKKKKRKDGSIVATEDQQRVHSSEGRKERRGNLVGVAQLAGPLLEGRRDRDWNRVSLRAGMRGRKGSLPGKKKGGTRRRKNTSSTLGCEKGTCPDAQGKRREDSGVFVLRSKGRGKAGIRRSCGRNTVSLSRKKREESRRGFESREGERVTTAAGEGQFLF